MIMGLLISRVGRIKSGRENRQHFNVGRDERGDQKRKRKRKGQSDNPAGGSECVQNSHFTFHSHLFPS